MQVFVNTYNWSLPVSREFMKTYFRSLDRLYTYENKVYENNNENSYPIRLDETDPPRRNGSA